MGIVIVDELQVSELCASRYEKIWCVEPRHHYELGCLLKISFAPRQTRFARQSGDRFVNGALGIVDQTTNRPLACVTKDPGKYHTVSFFSPRHPFFFDNLQQPPTSSNPPAISPTNSPTNSPANSPANSPVSSPPPILLPILPRQFSCQFSHQCPSINSPTDPPANSPINAPHQFSPPVPPANSPILCHRISNLQPVNLQPPTRQSATRRRATRRPPTCQLPTRLPTHHPPTQRLPMRRPPTHHSITRRPTPAGQLPPTPADPAGLR